MGARVRSPRGPLHREASITKFEENLHHRADKAARPHAGWSSPSAEPPPRAEGEPPRSTTAELLLYYPYETGSPLPGAPWTLKGLHSVEASGVRVVHNEQVQAAQTSFCSTSISSGSN